MRQDSHRLRILITTSTLPYREGDGQARFVLDLATALSSDSSVTVLAPHAPGALTRERVGRVEVRRFKYFFPSSLQRLAYGAGMRHNIDQGWLARIQVPFFLLAEFATQSWAALVRRPSVTNAHWLIPQGLTGALVARTFRIPLVVHVHAADIYFLRRFRFGRALARFVVKSSSGVLADGSHVRDSLDSLLGYESGALLRPMGVWFSQFGGDHSGRSSVVDVPKRFVVFVGRLVEKKGVEYLIRAMASVRVREPDLDLVIVGDGPLRRHLVALASELGISSIVHFIGSTSHDDVAILMRESEVACVPSVIDSRGETEGMPTVVLEAMAAGTRVVGSAVDGIPDVLRDTENGWLVEPGDPQSLAEGILTALSSDRANSIAAAGATTAQNHDWRVVADEYALILGQAAGV